MRESFVSKAFNVILKPPPPLIQLCLAPAIASFPLVRLHVCTIPTQYHGLI